MFEKKERPWAAEGRAHRWESHVAIEKKAHKLLPKTRVWRVKFSCRPLTEDWPKRKEVFVRVQLYGGYFRPVAKDAGIPAAVLMSDHLNWLLRPLSQEQSPLYRMGRYQQIWWESKSLKRWLTARENLQGYRTGGWKEERAFLVWKRDLWTPEGVRKRWVTIRSLQKERIS